MKSILFAVFCGIFALGMTEAPPATVNVHVDGDGYLRFVRDGKIVYAKSAKLTLVDGRLADVSGPMIVPAINLPSGMSFTVNLEGLVMANGQPYGQIVLALFPSVLAKNDNDNFVSSSMRPTLGNPGEGANGVIQMVKTAGTTVTDKSTKAIVPTRSDPPAKSTLQSSDKIVKPTPHANDSQSTSKTATKSLSHTVPVQIKISDRAEIESDTFSLGQIATITACESDVDQMGRIELGDTPPLGVDRIIDRNRISYRLKAAGFDPDKISLVGPDRIHVTRKGQQVVHSQFVENAILGAQAKGVGGTLESLTPGPDMTVPLGKLELVSETVNSTNLETNVTVGVYVDGKRFNSRTVKLKQTGATSTLKVGTIVSVRVVSHGVSVETKGKIMKVDQSTGQVTVQMVDTGAQLVGTMNANGSVEVKA